jgi:hypothetical protein
MPKITNSVHTCPCKVAMNIGTRQRKQINGVIDRPLHVNNREKRQNQLTSSKALSG